MLNLKDRLTEKELDAFMQQMAATVFALYEPDTPEEQKKCCYLVDFLYVGLGVSLKDLEGCKARRKAMGEAGFEEYRKIAEAAEANLLGIFSTGNWTDFQDG